MLIRVLLAVASLFLISAGTAAAACTAPQQAIQSQDQVRVEGDVSATIMGIGGGAGGSRDHTRSWEVNLPSQEAIDNQWYLYYLCVEHEAGRLPRSAYCEISSGIWERILGRPLSLEGCDEAPTVAPEPASTATPVESNSVMLSTAGRWSGATPGGQVFDFYGPYTMGREEVWYVDNLQGCISRLYSSGGVYIEELLYGACGTWTQIDMQPDGAGLRIYADGVEYFADFMGAQAADLSGTWSGTIERVKTQAISRVLLSGLKVFNIQISFDGEQPMLSWRENGCTSQLTEQTSGKGWTQYRESITSGSCSASQSVRIVGLSSDRLLLNYVGPLGMYVGIFRRES